MTLFALCLIVLLSVFAVCLSYSVNRDTYKGNGQLDKYEWEEIDNEK